MPRKLTILGSTGSIGCSALEVVRQYPDLFAVEVLAARSNADMLAAQIREFHPSVAALSDRDAARRLREMDLGVQVLDGPEGLKSAASIPVDVCLCAVVGAAGLDPLISAIDAGNRIALANKESLVMAGGLVMERASEKGVAILPVDSEHNAIFQCLHGHKISEVRCVHITASGGPFYGRSRASLAQVTPEEACRHPTWNMGAKISVDSATLMNKGLEVIEAMWLFGLPLDKIAVLIHPQSVIHSLVEFNDGGILGQLGVTDMKFPILFALTWPERVESPMARLDLTAVRQLTFAAPDFSKFPCLALALDAAGTGGTAPAILNAANEVAVSAFCARRIRFLEIEEVVKAVCGDMTVADADCLEAVSAADAAARKKAGFIVESLSR